LGEIAALLQAEQHAKDLRDGPVQPPGDFAYGEAGGGGREEFEDIETLFKGWSRVVALCRGFELGHKWFREKRFGLPKVTNVLMEGLNISMRQAVRNPCPRIRTWGTLWNIG
jgi:hypothetical protein